MEQLILKEFGPTKTPTTQTQEFSFGKMLFDTTVTYLPAPIAEYLYEQYACSKHGADFLRPENFNSVCKICLSTAKTTLKRKVLERQLLLKYQNQETPNFYAIIPTSWLINWKIFLFNDTEEDTFLRNYFFDAFPVQQKINNSVLFDDISEDGDITNFGIDASAWLRLDIENQRDYIFVNNLNWEILEYIYGCDIPIFRKEQDINSQIL
jgi:hypothetical protein